MAERRSSTSSFALLTDVLAHVTRLIRKEFDLARAEVSENLSRATVAIGLLIAAIVLFFVALNALAGAAIAGLTLAGLPTWAASLIVGGVLALIALAFTLKAVRDLKPSALAPTKTVARLKSDARDIKETFTHG